MAQKTKFEPIGTVVTSAFMNSIYKTDGGHKHDGIDSDGHASKITKDELHDNAVDYLSQKVSANVRNGGTIIGQIISYAGSDLPRGFLVCDGGEVSRAIYPEYYEWANNYAVDCLVEGGRVKTPDLRGLFLLGEGRGAKSSKTYSLGDTDGEETHTLIDEEMPEHRHGIYSHTNGGGSEAGNSNTSAGSGTSQMSGYAGKSQPHNNMPPYFVVRYLIRAYTEVEGIK
jgi:microcystin-dependent protein